MDCELHPGVAPPEGKGLAFGSLPHPALVRHYPESDLVKGVAGMGMALGERVCKAKGSFPEKEGRK